MSSKWITSLFKSVILTAALASSFAASAFTEGTDYMVLEKPIPKEGANKQVISSQADSLIKISRIWADFFPANTSNQPI